MRETRLLFARATGLLAALPTMISGISSGGYFPQPSANTSRKSANATPAQAVAPEVQPEPHPADLKAPEGDQPTLAREFNLFDLATRQFAQLLPRLELATVPLQ